MLHETDNHIQVGTKPHMLDYEENIWNSSNIES